MMKVGLHPMAVTAGATNEASDLRKPARAAGVVLAAHGERGGARELRPSVARRGAVAQRPLCGGSGRRPQRRAKSRGGPGGRAARTADELLVYPVFMSDGYFVRHVLAQRVAAAAGPSARTLAPLGLDPSLPPLMMREALAAAARAAFDAGSARLLVVGHGSSSRPNGASARATRRAAQLLAMTRTFADISVAFSKSRRSSPTVSPTAHGRPWSSASSREGLHALEDVPAAIAERSANAVYTGPIGALPEIADIIARADAAASPPA